MKPMSRLRSFLAFLAIMGGSICGLLGLAWWYVVPIGMVLLLWISDRGQHRELVEKFPRSAEWRTLMTEHYGPTADKIASRHEPTWADCVELAEIIWHALPKERADYTETGALAVPRSRDDGFMCAAYWSGDAIVALVEAVLTLGGGRRFDPKTTNGYWPERVQIKGGRHHG